ncbi:nuclear transport factor 2 family protein [Streptomyces sp. NPDC048516]|uniref:nuclear transport factor 2 family protein n=1 Tax=Streptomyces sp. NPDC048516 TaxID=3365565 RepID=UPI003722FB84
MTSTSDQERVWELHTTSEFSSLDLDTTMATMPDEPEVVHVPTARGARGRASVRHFYRRWFVGHAAADFAIEPLTRTTGGTRLVDEMLVSFTHDVEVPWILPGVPPTGRRVEIPLRAAVLGRTGLLPAETMARLPVVADQHGTLTDGPFNQPAGDPFNQPAGEQRRG